MILLSEQEFINSPESEFNINPLASSQLGAKHSPKTLAKISEILGGENHPNFGKSLSAETKAKMFITNKRKVKPKNIKQKFL